MHPRSSSVFYFCYEEKLISSFKAGFLIMSNGFLLLEDKKLQSLFKVISLYRLIRATNPLSKERKILPSTPQGHDELGHSLSQAGT